jgi:aerobic-type carbon monoxide dehydrogenase small subunit (CoxS/CutS family)
METSTVSSSGTDPGAIPVTLELNGRALSLPVAPFVTLLDLLRERLQLTGTNKGWDHGQCGYCTPGQLCSATALLAESSERSAVANAMYHATGKRVRSLPITVDKLLG